MGNENNHYIGLFAGIDKNSVDQVRETFFSHLNTLELEDSYITDEIKNDENMTIEELLDILELEAMDNRELKMFIFAIRLNLKKSKMSKQGPTNDSQLDKDIDSFEAL